MTVCVDTAHDVQSSAPMPRTMRCPECHSEVPSESHFCPGCGANLDGETTGKGSIPRKPPSSSSASTEGRFPIGGVLGERFRILGLLGGGGMGEVYRAHDLKLEQQVALKFLPQTAADNVGLRERLRGEVRIARQISHRNVCRVYDLGEIEGAPYISMEYVDGEDLGSLLRRIGRLPGDKAIEFARRICAGVAAAHERGVLHRDLKPANVMIDGRGQVFIMDFGLAAVAETIAGGDIRSGTPAYMAPEQRDGREVTVRSDIYSLGMVLGEMFTGQRPSENGTLTATTKDLDPAVEKIIQRCLDANPARRPSSALDVSRALPGGDPLAEALAAGETPSPEMVAASEDTGALSIRSAVACLVFIVAAIIGLIISSAWTNTTLKIPFPDSPEVMAKKAREIAQRAGYTDPPADTEYAVSNRGGLQAWARKNFKGAEYDAFVRNPRTSLRIFAYRQSPRDLATLDGTSIVTLDDPPPVVSGMISMILDPEGRLVNFRAVSPQQIDKTVSRLLDWKPMFEAAGLDPAQWTAAAPEWLPLGGFDEQAAWTGTFPDASSVPMRIEAASWKGRPVLFEIRGPWQIPTRDTRPSRTAGQRFQQFAILAIFAMALIVAATLAAMNYRHGRIDPHGAFRLGAFTFGSGLTGQLLLLHHVDFPGEITKLSEIIASCLYMGGVMVVLYMALEPFVRRRWPQSLISWTRLLNGAMKDPLVGGHMLIGAALGVGYRLLFAVQVLVLDDSPLPALSARRVIAQAGIALATESLGIALGILFFLFLARAIVHKEWLAGVIVVLFCMGALAPGSTSPLFMAVFVAVQFGAAVVILLRFGVLPAAMAIFVDDVLEVAPLTTDFSSWYTGALFISLAIVLAITLWSFRATLGSRKLLTGEFLERS
jgi:predicted Ser/Thr protein kinase